MFNKKISANFQQEIEYIRSDLAKRYEFSWMDEGTEIFDGVTMDINSNYVQQDKTESVSVGQFSSDIDFMLYNPDDFSEDGFALLCPTSSSSYYSLPIVQYTFIDEQQRSYTSRIQNLYASWSWIANNLYRYNMPAQKATINTIGHVTAFSVMRSMSHEVEFFSENDPDELLLIRTAFGNGKIDEMSINLDTRLVKASLMYKPQ